MFLPVIFIGLSAVTGVENPERGYGLFGINICVKDNFGIMFTLIIIEF